jgi:hypothetical protein
VRIGVIYPQFEFGSDPQAIRDYAQTAEALGSPISADDHIIGPNPQRQAAGPAGTTKRLFRAVRAVQLMAG